VAGKVDFRGWLKQSVQQQDNHRFSCSGIVL
jgi:hypothetical protein